MLNILGAVLHISLVMAVWIKLAFLGYYSYDTELNI